jgi:hypothetical protein
MVVEFKDWKERRAGERIEAVQRVELPTPLLPAVLEVDPDEEEDEPAATLLPPVDADALEGPVPVELTAATLLLPEDEAADEAATAAEAAAVELIAAVIPIVDAEVEEATLAAVLEELALAELPGELEVDPAADEDELGPVLLPLVDEDALGAAALLLKLADPGLLLADDEPLIKAAVPELAVVAAAAVLLTGMAAALELCKPMPELDAAAVEDVKVLWPPELLEEEAAPALELICADDGATTNEIV